MVIWDNIRNYFYRRKLAERLSRLNPKRSITNLEDAKSVGIIYDSTNPDNDIIITRFAENLKKQGKTIDMLGYMNDNKTDHKADIKVFNKTKLNWAMVPQDERVEKFAEKEFDLLFACFSEENLPLEYIARISRAKWRVGAYSRNNTDCYDLMIKVGERKDLPYMLEQATYFLNQIKYDPK